MPQFERLGLSLHYRDLRPDEPNGESVVLLHGLGNSGLDWEFQWPALLAAGYRVICPDLPGFGASRPGGDGRAVPAERLGPVPMAHDVVALLDTLSIERCHMVGYSMGGAVAYQFAIDQAPRVLTLGIISSVPCFVPQRLQDHWQFWLRHVVSRVLGMQRLAGKVVEGLFPGHPELMEKMRPRYAENDPWVYARMLEALASWDVRPRLGEIQCPVHILAGEFDYFRLQDIQESMQGLPQARLDVIAGATHGLPMLMPDAVNHALLALFSCASSDCSVSA
ncbi:alpha/beta hydrolase fold family protein [Oceanococcus atlanticus]|uniref:Alpha/beta hydrolase fold family protein n=1 Tax=Oceanococcus atlanticus TaxID=1317117 RepID=A0A1Y1SFW3_9GAMM|nr:alpha/beta hydrolase [Oceanococcus atlanticus]ORE88478.1 alpha/beta hydrolase fold family protein [Oceanococcus atlanticus]